MHETSFSMRSFVLICIVFTTGCESISPPEVFDTVLPQNASLSAVPMPAIDRYKNIKRIAENQLNLYQSNLVDNIDHYKTIRHLVGNYLNPQLENRCKKLLWNLKQNERYYNMDELMTKIILEAPEILNQEIIEIFMFGFVYNLNHTMEETLETIRHFKQVSYDVTCHITTYNIVLSGYRIRRQWNEYIEMMGLLRSNLNQYDDCSLIEFMSAFEQLPAGSDSINLADDCFNWTADNMNYSQPQILIAYLRVYAIQKPEHYVDKIKQIINTPRNQKIINTPIFRQLWNAHLFGFALSSSTKGSTLDLGRISKKYYRIDLRQSVDYYHELMCEINRRDVSLLDRVEKSRKLMHFLFEGYPYPQKHNLTIVCHTYLQNMIECYRYHSGFSGLNRVLDDVVDRMSSYGIGFDFSMNKLILHGYRIGGRKGLFVQKLRVMKNSQCDEYVLVEEMSYYAKIGNVPCARQLWQQFISWPHHGRIKNYAQTLKRMLAAYWNVFSRIGDSEGMAYVVGICYEFVAKGKIANEVCQKTLRIPQKKSVQVGNSFQPKGRSTRQYCAKHTDH